MFVVSIVGGFTLVMIVVLVIVTRRIRRREAAAREAEVVEAPLAGAILNRQSIVWLGCLVVFAVAMGALSGPHGPIDQHSAWTAALLVVGILVGVGGFTFAAMRSRGGLRLEPGALVVTAGDRVRRFDLDADFEFGEFALPPSHTWTNGGAGVIVRQGETEASFWYPNDLKYRHGPAGAERLTLLDAPPEDLRSNGLGRVIHERLRRRKGW